MSTLQGIWDGVKSIIWGGIKIAVSAGQAVWALLKFACKAALWVIVGCFYIAYAGYDYIVSTIKDFFRPKKIITIGPKTLDPLSKFIEKQREEGKITEDDEEMIIDLTKRCKEGSDNGEMLIMAKGQDENGSETLAEPKFVKADDYEQKIKDCDERGSIYVKKIKLVS